jgi:hypothetical protein
MSHSARGALIAIIEAHQKGRIVDVERLLEIMMDAVPRYSGERTFEEQPTITATQQDKIEQLTATERAVLLECTTDLTSLLKTIIKRQMS